MFHGVEPTSEEATRIAAAIYPIAFEPSSLPTHLQERATALWQQCVAVAYSDTLADIRALPEAASTA